MSQSRTPVARRLLEVTMLMMRSVGADMRHGGGRLPPPQFGLLLRIGASPCGLTDLARHHGVRLPTISKSIALFARHGWVERHAIPGDRRRVELRLTPAGRRLVAAVKRQAERHVAGLLATLGAGERRQLDATLDALTAALAVTVKKDLCR